jgi:hypothetical protein
MDGGKRPAGAGQDEGDIITATLRTNRLWSGRPMQNEQEGT